MESFLCFTFQWRTEGLSCSVLHLLTSINYSHETFESILYLQNKNCHIYIWCMYMYIYTHICLFCQDSAPKNYNGSSQNYWKTKNLLKFSVFPKKSQIWLIIAWEVQCLRQILCHQLHLSGKVLLGFLCSISDVILQIRSWRLVSMKFHLKNPNFKWVLLFA